jgi:hypothetical protein
VDATNETLYLDKRKNKIGEKDSSTNKFERKEKEVIFQSDYISV